MPPFFSSIYWRSLFLIWNALSDELVQGFRWILHCTYGFQPIFVTNKIFITQNKYTFFFKKIHKYFQVENLNKIILNPMILFVIHIILNFRVRYTVYYKSFLIFYNQFFFNKFITIPYFWSGNQVLVEISIEL